MRGITPEGNVQVKIEDDGTIKANLKNKLLFGKKGETLQHSNVINSEEEWVVLSLTNKVNEITKKGKFELKINSKVVDVLNYNCDDWGTIDLKPINIGGMCNKEIGELVVFDDQVDDAQIQGMEKYLVDLYLLVYLVVLMQNI